MEISIIKEDEIEEVSKLIEKTVRKCFVAYYPQKTIDKVCENLDYEGVKKRASWTHFYVIKEDNKIVACGAIGPYWGSETESSLFTIFVDPEYQGNGYGRKIMETLESDEFFLRARRIQIPAGLVAIPFYKKFGYEYKNGEMIFEDGHFALEKFNPNYQEKEL
ncbi:MAG: GNAT family N-acetyltransferase [Clostridia bacterium]|nr:GNAT family N-acetyltransferase [Clostridia bacterium]